MKTLIFVVAAAVSSIVGFVMLHHRYQDVRLQSFSAELRVIQGARVIAYNDHYVITSKLNQEFDPQLYFFVQLANQHESWGRGNWIPIKMLQEKDNYDFTFSEGWRKASQEIKFDNGDIVRIYWFSEKGDSNRHVMIHSVANHFRDGRLLDTKVDEMEIEFRFEEVEESS